MKVLTVELTQTDENWQQVVKALEDQAEVILAVAADSAPARREASIRSQQLHRFAGVLRGQLWPAGQEVG